ncbi:hypothetical protein [Pontibacter beigongshangensis]|uniref:hypothetical protein n=1 Tax=Pontibacter beigongshangensis TaxID=2574733 RepID=UPI00164FB8C0|nr:hypothetical protein [Pontibacter beigongshangensis]
MRIKFTFVLSTVLLFLLCSYSSYATVYRVNNTLPTDKGQKIFNSLLEAHNEIDVAAGDTLMVEGSATTYAGLTMTKQLVIIGPGYFLTDNPQTQANPVQAVVQNITVEPTASGSVLMGLTFAPSSSAYTPYVNANNVIIMRCYMPNPIVLIGQLMNIQIIQSYFVGNALSISSSAYNFTGLAFKNNIVGGGVNISSTNQMQRIFAAVEHNIFLGTNITLTTSSFRNNIVVNRNATVNVSSNTIQNNLVSNTQIPAGNGNQTYSESQLFVGPAGASPDGQYKLKENSPYLTAGFGSTQPGIYGGNQPYMLSGMPPIPSIYEFNAESFGSRQNGLPVSIKARANQ